MLPLRQSPLQVHTCLQVELDHGRGGARSGASCLLYKSSVAKVHVQPTVMMVLYRFTRALRNIARHTFAVIVPFIARN